MKIDSHHHVWDLSVRDQDWIVGDALAPINRNFSMDDLREATQNLGIDKTIVVQTVTNYGETPELLALAQSDEMIAGVVGWLDVSASDALNHLDSYMEAPGSNYLKGIRDIVQDNPNSNYLAQPQVAENIKELGKRNLAFDILTKTPELPGAIELVGRCPDVQFVLDHISKPYISKGEFEPWASLIKELAKYENVVCKISGMITEANWKNWKSAEILPYFEIIAENFGTNRLMFGSDWPVCTLSGNYKDVFNLANLFATNFGHSESDSFWSGCAINAYSLSL